MSLIRINTMCDVQKIREAGGKVYVERLDAPGVGAFSMFEDPDGRVNGLWLQLKKKE